MTSDLLVLPKYQHIPVRAHLGAWSSLALYAAQSLRLLHYLPTRDVFICFTAKTTDPEDVPVALSNSPVFTQAFSCLTIMCFTTKNYSSTGTKANIDSSFSTTAGFFKRRCVISQFNHISDCHTLSFGPK